MYPLPETPPGVADRIPDHVFVVSPETRLIPLFGAQVAAQSTVFRAAELPLGKK
jgi:hypothetical protein